MNSPADWDPVLVTGATGFLGGNLVRELLRRGCTVHVLLRPGSSRWRLLEVLDRLHVHQGDLLDGPGLDALVAQVRPRLVYHLATYGAYERQGEARRILDTNILGTLHLLEACERHGTGLLVSTGSSSEYGFKSAPMKETDLLEPASYYAVAKAAQTHLCLLHARRGHLAAVVFRLFSVYGPWEEPDRLIPTVIRRARAGLPLEMVAPDVVRDFVYVDDVLAALLEVDLLQGLRGEVLNLGTGVETSLEQLAAAVRELMASNSEVRWGAMRPRPWDTTRWVCDPGRARELLGWSPKCALPEGLARTAAWMKQVGDDYGATHTPRSS